MKNYSEPEPDQKKQKEVLVKEVLVVLILEIVVVLYLEIVVVIFDIFLIKIVLVATSLSSSSIFRIRNSIIRH